MIRRVIYWPEPEDLNEVVKEEEKKGRKDPFTKAQWRILRIIADSLYLSTTLFKRDVGRLIHATLHRRKRYCDIPNELRKIIKKEKPIPFTKEQWQILREVMSHLVRIEIDATWGIEYDHRREQRGADKRRKAKLKKDVFEENKEFFQDLKRRMEEGDKS